MHRYKRRLVCNPCEKNKLKEDGTKKSLSKYSVFLSSFVDLCQENVSLRRRNGLTAAVLI